MKHEFNPLEHSTSSGMNTTTKAVPWYRNGIQLFGKLTTLILLSFLFTVNANAQCDSPLNLSAVANVDPTCIDVTFDPGTDGNSESITFEVSNAGGGLAATSQTTNLGAGTVTICGLTSSSDYTVIAFANCGANGNSANTASVNVTTNRELPTVTAEVTTQPDCPADLDGEVMVTITDEGDCVGQSYTVVADAGVVAGSPGTGPFTVSNLPAGGVNIILTPAGAPCADIAPLQASATVTSTDVAAPSLTVTGPVRSDGSAYTGSTTTTSDTDQTIPLGSFGRCSAFASWTVDLVEDACSDVNDIEITTSSNATVNYDAVTGEVSGNFSSQDSPFFVEITATDEAGNSTTYKYEFRVDDFFPSVIIAGNPTYTIPPCNDEITASMVLQVGDDCDSPIETTRVTLTAPDVTTGAPTKLTANNFEFTFPLTLADDGKIFTATYTDRKGQTRTETYVISVNAQTGPPCNDILMNKDNAYWTEDGSGNWSENPDGEIFEKDCSETDNTAGPEYVDDGGRLWNYSQTLDGKDTPACAWVFCPSDPCTELYMEFTSFSVHEDDLFHIYYGSKFDANGPTGNELAGSPFSGDRIGDVNGGWVKSNCTEGATSTDPGDRCLTVVFDPKDDRYKGEGWVFKLYCKPIELDLACPDDAVTSGTCQETSFDNFDLNGDGDIDAADAAIDLDCALIDRYTITAPTGGTDCVDVDYIVTFRLNDLGGIAGNNTDLLVFNKFKQAIHDGDKMKLAAGETRDIYFLADDELDFKNNNFIELKYEGYCGLVVSGDLDILEGTLLDSDECIQKLSLSPPSLVCNDDVNIGLPYSCKGVISPDDVLENPCCLMTYTIKITTPDGQVIQGEPGEPVPFDGSCSGSFNVEIKDNCGNYCSTDVEFDDRIAPSITLHETAKVWCGDEFDDENNPTATDNCGTATEPVIISERESEEKCNLVMLDPIQGVFVPAPGVDKADVKPCIVWDATGGEEEIDILGKKPFEFLYNKDIEDGSKTIVWESEDECGNKARKEEVLFKKRPAIVRMRVPTKTAIVGCLDDAIPTPEEIMAMDGFDVKDAMPFFWDGEDANSLTAIQNELFGGTFDASLLGKARRLDHSCSISVTYEDSQKANFGCGYKVFRTWTLYDWCFNYFLNDLAFSNLNFPITSFTQVLIIEDTEAPEFTTASQPDKFGTNPLDCETNMMITPPVARDNCDDYPTVSWRVEDAIGNELETGTGIAPITLVPGAYKVFYTAKDECGNESTEQEQDLLVEDDDEPICYADRYTVVPLNNDASGSVRVCADNLDSGSKDNCKTPTLLIKKMSDAASVDFTKCVYLSCADLTANCETGIMIRFRAYDDLVDGAVTAKDVNFDLLQGRAYRFSECMVEVELQDKFAPTITCSPSKEFFCNDIDIANIGDLFTAPVATDNCDDAPKITMTNEVNTLNDCGLGYVERTWQAEDKCGNLSQTCSQRITVKSESDYTVTFPKDVTVSSCDALEAEPTAAGAGVPTITGASLPCQHILISDPDSDNFEQRYTDPVTGDCIKIVRTWCVMDWCVFDKNKGDYLTDPATIDPRTFRDGGDGIVCFTQVIKVVAPTAQCSAIVEGTSIALDEPNSGDPLDPTNFQQTTITTSDIDAGSFGFTSMKLDFGAGEVDSKTFDCIDISTPASTNNIDVNLILKIDGEDDVTCATTFRVVDDITPTIICGGSQQLNLTMDVGVEHTFTEADLASLAFPLFDNCGIVSVKFVPAVFTCTGANTSESVEITLVDATGNQKSCDVPLNINCLGAQASIAGTIENEFGESVEEVTVEANGSEMASIVTAADGQFQFDEAAENGSYVITPTKDINPLNGVTTYDLVLISQHILGTKEISSPYARIAADVNKSGGITGSDMVQIRKLILNKIQTFTNNTSWRFIDGAYEFPDPTNPWSSPFPEVYNITELQGQMMDLNFVAIKTGDVNGNAAPNTVLGARNRNKEGQLNFVVEDKWVKKGEQVSLSFTADEFEAMLGYQFALQFNTQVLDFVNVNPVALSGLTKGNFGMNLLDKGIITTSWNDLSGQAVSMKNGATLFEFNFIAKADTKLSDAVGLSSRFMAIEAYNSNQEVMDIGLQFGAELVVNEPFTLFQNKPNPFHTVSIIGFSLPIASSATLTIYDVSGRTLSVITRDFDKGYNEVRIDKSDLSTTGVLYYRLDSATHTATKKMIILD